MSGLVGGGVGTPPTCSNVKLGPNVLAPQKISPKNVILDTCEEFPQGSPEVLEPKGGGQGGGRPAGGGGDWFKGSVGFRGSLIVGQEPPEVKGGG